MIKEAEIMGIIANTVENLANAFEMLRNQSDSLYKLDCEMLALVRVVKETDPKLAALFEEHLGNVRRGLEPVHQQFTAHLDGMIAEIRHISGLARLLSK